MFAIKRIIPDDTMSLAVLCLGAITAVLNSTMLTALVVPLADAFGRSDGATGQLATVTALASMAVAFLMAPFVDRYDRRQILRLQALLVIVSATVFSLAPTFSVLILGRILAGMAGAIMVATCFAVNADMSRESHKRNQSLGILVSATTIGIAVGIPVVARMEELAGWRVAGSLVIGFALLFLAGSKALPVSQRDNPGSASARSQMRAVLGNRQIS